MTDLFVLHAHVFVEEPKDLVLRLEKVWWMRCVALGPNVRVDEHVTSAHDEPISIEHEEQLHKPVYEVEVGFDFPASMLPMAALL